MNTNRFEQGLNKLGEVDGHVGEMVVESLKDIAPDLGKYIVEFAFGDIYCRDSLDLKEREMVTLASLLTQGGCENQLEVHINGALNVGVSAKKVVEVFLQCIPYTGFPRVLNAVGVAKKVFQIRNISAVK
jgi:4-carboxymuconolactone decarboxylase